MLQVGQLLHGRYQLKGKLGENPGRQTWLAEDTITQPPESVVVKVLAFSDRAHWDTLKLFEREARVLQNLNHPRIPKYRDYFSIEDRLVWFGLVQEYIPGSSLKDLLAQGRKFSEAEVRQIATEVLEILIYLHELSPPVLHRDIKPSNLMLGEDDRIYLIDFGAVQDRSITEGATFTVVGTYGYAPMEQFGGRAVPASDLYALGATMIHLLTGVAPADLPQQNLRVQFREYVSVSDRLVQWIEILTEPDVNQRFRTARQALEALKNPVVFTTALPVSKPYGSRIQLKQSSNQLVIKLPIRGMRRSDFFLAVFVVVWFGITIPMAVEVFPFILIFWFAGLIMLRKLIVPSFSQMHLKFDRELFVLKWKLMGITYRQIEGKISAIEDVRVSRELSKIENARPLIGVVIKAGVKEYAFGRRAPTLSDAEQDWLVQEIKDWLQLKSRSPQALLPS